MSSRELKTLKFSSVLRTHENFDVFNTLDEIYLVFTSKRLISSIYFYFFFHSPTINIVCFLEIIIFLRFCLCIFESATVKSDCP